MTELELKLQVPEHVVASLQAELRRRGAQPLHLQAHYYDTPDFALDHHRVALRMRNEAGAWMQTLKAAGESAVHRLEHNVPLHHAGATPPPLKPSRHDGTDAAPLLRQALHDAPDRTLAVRYRTDVTRLVCDLALPGAVVEAALDIGVLEAGGREATIRELELEHKSGDPAALFELGRVWSAYGGLWLDTVSKAQRGVRLARGELHGPAVKASRAGVHRGMTGTQFLRAILRSTLDQVLANASEVAAGSTEEEHVHQLRVGLRRLRSALRELDALDARIDAGWTKPLARAFAHLGEVRDDVTAARAARPLLEQTVAPKLQWEPRPAADPGAAVRDTRFQSTLIDLLGFALREDEDARAAAAGQLEPILRARLSRLHKRIVRASPHFDCLPLEDQHQVRKRLKRLRYLAEFAAPLGRQKAAKRYLAHLEPAQDALGRHLDIAVAMRRFYKDAESDSRATFSARYLEAYLGNTARIARDALRAIRDARPFWRR
jgi:inorganic triphosphatase YgiF